MEQITLDRATYDRLIETERQLRSIKQDITDNRPLYTPVEWRESQQCPYYTDFIQGSFYSHYENKVLTEEEMVNLFADEKYKELSKEYKELEQDYIDTWDMHDRLAAKSLWDRIFNWKK